MVEQKQPPALLLAAAVAVSLYSAEAIVASAVLRSGFLYLFKLN